MRHLLCKPTRLRLMKSVTLGITCFGKQIGHTHNQGCKNPGHKASMATEFCTVRQIMNGSSAWHFKHFTLLEPKILRCCLDLWIICAPLLITTNNARGFSTCQQYQTWQRCIYRWGYVRYILQMTKTGAWTIRSSSRLVFLNRRAAARYRALASMIPGRERFSWNLSF